MENPICPSSDQDFRLIETFGYHPGQGIARASLHEQRLQNSAKVLGFEFDRPKVLLRMAGIASEAPLRCRMTLGRAGDLDLTIAPMPAKLDVMRFVMSGERLTSSDVMLRHKTTRRDLYDRERAALPDGVDEVVFLNERDEICEGSITNIAITTGDGVCLTPPLSSGCLPGVYRQSQIDQGHWREAVLTLNDLRDVRRISLTNALRGATQAIWAPQCSQFT